MARTPGLDNANIVSTRLPLRYAAAIDKIAAAEIRTRSDVARMLLIRQLVALEATAAKN